MDLLKRGQEVLAKTFGGVEVLRLVWEDVGDTVYLCSDSQFEALTKGWGAPMPIGFPKRDVRKK